MELGPGWVEWGLLGLFLASFLAATILPFSSEAVLLGLASTGIEPASLFVWATLGNTLGGLGNYALGRWLPTDKVLHWFHVDVRDGQRWAGLVRRRGAWVALLCWIPVIGDPIAIALGLFRAALVPTALLMLLGKAMRYAILLWLVQPFVVG